MRNAVWAVILCLCASLLLNMSGIHMASAAAADNSAAIDDADGKNGKNFIFYVDISGSMSLGYHERGASKIDVTVQLLHALNNEMPDLNANVGVYTYRPHEEYRRVTPFDRDELRDVFNQIPTDFTFAARPTPMARGIQNLDTTIAALPGHVAFVVVTDGESNMGPPPAEVIQDVYDRYGERVCFHFISLAKNASEKAFVQSLADLNACSVTAEAVDLLDPSARADFIEKVFGQ